MLELVGEGCSIRFNGRACELRFSGPRAWLGRLTVPVTALAGVEHAPPKWRRKGRLVLVTRPGADPFTLVGSADPYTIEFTGRQDAEPLVRGAAGGDRGDRAGGAACR